jgi:hypothetical protein
MAISALAFSMITTVQVVAAAPSIASCELPKSLQLETTTLWQQISDTSQVAKTPVEFENRGLRFPQLIQT